MKSVREIVCLRAQPTTKKSSKTVNKMNNGDLWVEHTLSAAIIIFLVNCFRIKSYNQSFVQYVYTNFIYKMYYPYQPNVYASYQIKPFATHTREHTMQRPTVSKYNIT